MNFQLYLECFGVAMVGMALHTTLKMKSLQDKARLANVEFRVSDYFKYDWLSIMASVFTVILFLFFLKYGVKRWPQFADGFTILFGFIGYTGSDVASRLFSVVNKRINTAIDYKTTAADTRTGDLDAPTALPKKPGNEA